MPILFPETPLAKAYLKDLLSGKIKMMVMSEPEGYTPGDPVTVASPGGPIHGVRLPPGYTPSGPPGAHVQRLVEMIDSNDADAVVAECARDPTICNATDTGGYPMLWIAASNGSPSIVKALMTAPALDLNLCKESTKSTPVFIASQNSHAEIVRILAEAGADLNARNHQFASPAFIASQNLSGMGSKPDSNSNTGSALTTLKTLIEFKADINLTDDAGLSPLSFVVPFDRNGVVTRTLLEAKADVHAVDCQGNSPIHRAIAKGNDLTLRLLIGAKAEVNRPSPHGCTPLVMSIELNHANAVKVLLDAGADVAAETYETRSVFSLAPNVTLMLKLYAAKSSQPADAGGPEDSSKESDWGPGADEILRLMNINNKSVVKKSVVKKIQAKLKQKPALVNATRNGQTLLWMAAAYGKKGIVEALIQGRADVNRRNPAQDLTPLMAACQGGYTTVVELLLAAGADVHAIARIPNTALLALHHTNAQKKRIVSADAVPSGPIASMVLAAMADAEAREEWLEVAAGEATASKAA